MVDFQELIRKIQSRGKSLGWIAERCECAPSTIGMLATGKNTEPRYSLGQALLQLEVRTRRRSGT